MKDHKIEFCKPYTPLFITKFHKRDESVSLGKIHFTQILNDIHVSDFGSLFIKNEI